MAQTMKSAHDLMSNMPNKSDSFVFTRTKGGKEEDYSVTVKARTDKNWLDYARRLTSSMVAFTSDPMDTGGLKSYERYFRELHDAYFEISEINQKKEKINKD